jgi:hypothetical protein
MPPVPEPSWRKPVGVLALLAYLAVYAVLVASAGGWLSSLPTALMAMAYLLLGLAWVLPLKPLFLWMNTGRWSRS